MEDAIIIIVIIFAIAYVFLSMNKKDFFLSVPTHTNYQHPPVPVHHLPYNHLEPPYINDVYRDVNSTYRDVNNFNNVNRGNYRNCDNGTSLDDIDENNTLYSLNDVDDIINNYENINNSVYKKYINNGTHKNINRNSNRNDNKEVYINNERKNNRNNYANFKDKVYRNGVAFTQVDKLAEIRSNPYDNNIGNIGDTISNVYDNLLSTTYNK
jgi:hypothetical protein